MFLLSTDIVNTSIKLGDLVKNDIATILVPLVFSFLIGMILAPRLISKLNQYKFWRQEATLRSLDGKKAPITQKLNKDADLKVPRMGGLVIILASVLALVFFWLISLIDRTGFIHELNFVSRAETWVVIFTLISGSIIGMWDDLAVTGNLSFLKGKLKEYIGGGLSLQIRLSIACLIGCVVAWWFYYQLGIDSIYLPFIGSWSLGLIFLPFVVLVVMATYSGTIIDGVDGLAGGVFATIFMVYGFISLFLGHVDLATFCFVIVGAILAFLWHNIPPAKFYMSETGSMALAITLSVVAFQTGTVALLPIIALPLLITTLSVILQVIWKKFFKRKLFLVSPLHNYFRAKGLPDHNVVMRYWIISQISAFSGLVIFILGYN